MCRKMVSSVSLHHPPILPKRRRQTPYHSSRPFGSYEQIVFKVYVHESLVVYYIHHSLTELHKVQRRYCLERDPYRLMGRVEDSVYYQIRGFMSISSRHSE